METAASDLDVLEYFAGQSAITDPGAQVGALEGLPADLGGLQRVANGLVLHFRLEDPAALGIDKERFAEVDSRYADVMLARIKELDERPLSVRRDAGSRLIGCCRDFTVLFLTMARARGIPARARVGFATYFCAGYATDHEVAEVWDADQLRWRLVDPQLKGDQRDPTDDTPIDPTDVPRDRFITAGAAWASCKAGAADPETFLVRPEIELPVTRGWPYIAHNMVLDLAGLNKTEMLLWDLWGLSGKALHGLERGEREEAVYAEVAAVTAPPEPDIAAARALYRSDPELEVTGSFFSLSPAGFGPREVELRR